MAVEKERNRNHHAVKWVSTHKPLMKHIQFAINKLINDVDNITSLSHKLSIGIKQLSWYRNGRKFPFKKVTDRIINNILNDDEYVKCLPEDTLKIFRTYLNHNRIINIPVPSIDQNCDNIKRYEKLLIVFVDVLNILNANFKCLDICKKLYINEVQLYRYRTKKSSPRLSTIVRTINYMFNNKEFVDLLSESMKTTLSEYIHDKNDNDEIEPVNTETTNSYTTSVVKQKIRLKNIRFAAKVLCDDDLSGLKNTAGWLEIIGKDHPNIMNLIELGIMPANKILGIDTDVKISNSLKESYPDCIVMNGDIKNLLSMCHYNYQVFNIDTCMSLYEGGELDIILTEFSKNIPSLLKIHKKIVVFVTVCVSGTIRIDAKQGNRENDDYRRIDLRLLNYFPNHKQSVEVDHYKNDGYANKMCQYRIEFSL